jgi:hypothetical protein
LVITQSPVGIRILFGMKMKRIAMDLFGVYSANLLSEVEQSGLDHKNSNQKIFNCKSGSYPYIVRN